MNEELKYKIAVSMIRGVGSITARNLISYAGSIEGVFLEKRSNLLKIPGVGTFVADQIVNSKAVEQAEKEIEFIQQKGYQVLFYLDEKYPERLRHCQDAPLVLFVEGETDLNASKVISIVGTRSATDEGVENTTRLVRQIKEKGHNVLVVSGLAYGIDIVAHRTALENGLPTIAVLGHGLHMIYPVMHRRYADQIAGSGALITEFTSQVAVDKNNFIRRNRIIAGISDATVVVESGVKGGALVTADIANSYNRDVFAFPGRVRDTYSQGCNKLIKSHKAVLIEGAADLEYILGWEPETKTKKTVQTQLFLELDEEEQEVVSLLKEQTELPIDHICLKMNQSTSKVSPLLLNLEFKGVVKSLPGKVYKLVN
jgi:DNA processing protein